MSTPEEKRKAEDRLIQRALLVLTGRMRSIEGPEYTSPADVKSYARLLLSSLEHEEFHVMYLDVRHRLVAAERAAIGTIHEAHVHPREVVKRALALNAAAVIFLHNHPSGQEYASDADKRLTAGLADALRLVDVRVLDHIVVGGMRTFSFAENGLM